MSNEVVPSAFRHKLHLFKSLAPQKLSASWLCPVYIRYSDEDTNSHVNHASYFRFFHDSKLIAARKFLTGKDPNSVTKVQTPPEILAQLCMREIESFFISYVREVKILAGLDYQIRGKTLLSFHYFRK